MPVVIGSSVGGLLLLVVIIALLVKVSSSPVCKKEKALGSGTDFSASEDS